MIGRRLKEYRKKKGLTLKELGAKIGYSHGGLSEIENEKATPSTETLLRLVQNSDINLSWLFSGEGPMEAPAIMVSERSFTILDDTTLKIVDLLKDMPEDARREILKNVEDTKLLAEIREERKKLKNAG